jgi:hypothetical protein
VPTQKKIVSRGGARKKTAQCDSTRKYFISLLGLGFCFVGLNLLGFCFRVNELVLNRCDRLSAADLALLSAALTAAGVCLTKLECAVQNTEGSGMSDAVAALCSAHPSIECLSLAGLDDSDHHPDTRQRYPLIAALVGSVEPTRLRQIRLPNTPPPPVDFDLLAIKAYEHQDKVDTMFFTFEGSPNSATLYAHADAYSKPRSGSWFAYKLFD